MKEKAKNSTSKQNKMREKIKKTENPLKGKCFIIILLINRLQIKRTSKLKRNKRQMRNLYLTKVKDDPITLGDWNDCNGGFSKPSAATGKSFDDLWNDRLTA